MNNNNSGFFITFEGGEGSGKTSLLEEVFSLLSKEGYPVFKTRAPGGTPLGSKIRNLVLHTDNVNLGQKAELLLFAADRAQHVEEVIKKELLADRIVLCDRFNDSTIAYQGASRQKLDLDFVEKICSFASEGILPNLTFYLDVDTKEGLLRAQKAIQTDGKEAYDRLEKENVEFHENVRKAYLDLADKYKDRIVVLNANESKETVLENALEILKGKLQNYAQRSGIPRV